MGENTRLSGMRMLASVLLLVLPLAPTKAGSPQKAISVTIDLQSGFKGEPVTVRVDGSDVAHRDKVISSPTLGFAKRYVHETTAGRKKLEIVVGEKENEKRFEIEILLDRAVFLGIQCMYDRYIQLEVSHHKPVYM